MQSTSANELNHDQTRQFIDTMQRVQQIDTHPCRVGEIQAKTLVLAAEFDRVIKMNHTQKLLVGFKGDVSFHILQQVGHNDIADNPKYFELLSEFL